jgi:hypothetical protein
MNEASDLQSLVSTECPQPARKVGRGKPDRSGPPGNGNARTHGLNTLKTAVVKLGGRAIDGRYRVGRQLQKWRRELVEDLGGQDNISTQ